MDIKLIFGALTLHFLALITPGPDFILTVRNTLQYGKVLGFATSLGFSLGIAIHVSYSIAGMALLLKEYPQAYNFIRYLGASYLLWIGIQGLLAMRKKSKTRKIELENLKQKNFLDCLAQGFLTNILNPKATLFILGIYTSIGRPETTLATLFGTGLGMITMTALWFGLVTIVFSIERIRQTYLKAEKVLNILFGIFFISVGAILFLN